MIRLVLVLAWREVRGGWRPLTVLAACTAVGVAALVAVTGLAGRLDRTVSRQARALMGGDLELRSPRPLDAEAEAALGRLQAGGAGVSRVRELAAMARHPGRGTTLLTELKAVDGRYPLYGRVQARPDRPLAELLAEGGALADEAALRRLGLAVGDRLVLGEVEVTVRGVLEAEPDRAARVLTLGPRLLVAAGTLDRTGLVRPGSRVAHRALLRLPEGQPAAAARDALLAALADPAVRLTAFDEVQTGWRRFYRQLTAYMALVGLASLLVGGVGVAAAVRAFVRRKRETLAVLKALGASWRLLLAAYLVQAGALGLAGSLVGAGLGLGLAPLVGRLIGDLLPHGFELAPDATGWLAGVAIGTLVTLLVALPPLVEVRTVSPALLFRRDVAGAVPGRGRWLAALPLAAGGSGLVFWYAASPASGLIFLGAVVAALAVLAAVGRGLGWLGRRVPRLPWLAWRQGLANLARPGGHGSGVVVALGIGVMLLVAVGLLEAGLDRQLDHERRRQAPSFFFVDVQPGQARRLARLVREAGGEEPTLTPVVRARLAAVDGAEVTRALIEQRQAAGHEAAWYLTRDYVLTASGTLPAGNVVTAGRWWDGAGGPPAQASVEEAAARHLGVGVGSRLAFDVQGVRVEAEVTSLRRVDWQALTTNFFVILSPGLLDGAPTTLVGTARVAAAAEAALQDAVVAALPGVTAIPVRDVLERIGTLLDQMAVAVRAVAAFALTAGLVVMAGALSASRYQRLAESVILRTLGATRGTVARGFAVEYACLGLAAGAGGSALAVGLAWAVRRFVLDMPWALEPLALALGVTVPALLALAVGGLATWRLLGDRPWPVLRQE